MATARRASCSSPFAVIRDTLRDLLRDEWSPGMAQAWDRLLIEIDAFAAVQA